MYRSPKRIAFSLGLRFTVTKMINYRFPQRVLRIRTNLSTLIIVSATNWIIFLYVQLKLDRPVVPVVNFAPSFSRPFKMSTSQYKTISLCNLHYDFATIGELFPHLGELLAVSVSISKWTTFCPKNVFKDICRKEECAFDTQYTRAKDVWEEHCLYLRKNLLSSKQNEEKAITFMNCRKPVQTRKAVKSVKPEMVPEIQLMDVVAEIFPEVNKMVPWDVLTVS